MTPPVINQLLEEAVQRTVELTGRADSAAADALQVYEQATALGQLATQEAEALHQDLTKAVEAVSHLHSQIEQAAAHAKGALDLLPAAADGAETELRELLSGFHADVAHLNELNSRIVGDVDRSTQQVEGDFNHLGGSIQQFHSTLDAQLNDVEARVDTLRQAVHEARTHLNEERAQLSRAIQAQGELALADAEVLGACMQAATVLIARKVVDVCNHTIGLHNTNCSALRTGVTGDTPTSSADPTETWVHEAVQPILDEVAGLDQLRQPAEASLETAVQSIEEKAETVRSGLETMANQLHGAVPTIGQ
jgi:hypothetical protein